LHVFNANVSLKRFDEVATRIDAVRGGNRNGGAVGVNETHDDRHGTRPLAQGDG
jgi:hypothetical protein